MNYEAINFRKKFALFDEKWQPKVIAEMNDYQFKIVKLQGDFIWHDHKNTDETFIVLEGTLRSIFGMAPFTFLPVRCLLSRRALSTSLMPSMRLSCC
jgi:mannose-6-phosphate isomerase-like protein (cupin superfamily)